MSRKVKKPLRTAPMQKYVLRPIEDPAEQAALDERLNRCQEAITCDTVKDSPLGKLTASVVELCRELSSKARLQVAMELLEQLSLDQHVVLLDRLAAQVPAMTLRRIEEQLRERTRGVGDEGAGTHEKHRKEGA